MSKLQGEILTLPKMSGNVGAKTISIGGIGGDGATFIPYVSDDGIISWTNDKDLPNPEPVDISGKDGVTPHIGTNSNWYIGDNDTGVRAQGYDGKDGKDVELVQSLGESEDKAISQKVVTSHLISHENRITNLEQKLDFTSFVTDDSIAYVKTVPVNALTYAEVNKIGGMAKKCTNLIPYPYIHTTKTIDGITFTDNGDGSVTANGTATANAVFYLQNNLTLPSGNYVLSFNDKNSNLTVVLSYPGENGKTVYISSYGEKSFLLTEEKKVTLYLQVHSGYTVSNFVFDPMLNEGKTALPYESYFEGLRSAKVTEIESMGADGEILSTYSVPKAVRNLDGYGEGNPDNAEEYNAIIYIDGKWRYSHKGNIVNNAWTPLAESIITDISDILPINIYIEVEGGGTITMVNEHQYDVPSEITYQVKRAMT